MGTGQIGAVVFTSFGNAPAFFFILSHGRGGHQHVGQQGSGSSSDPGTLVHGKSPVKKTWLVGILKHKVIDLIRCNTREICLPDSDADNEGDELDKLAFKTDGHFVDPPASWGDPQQTLQQRQFFEVLDACMERLPPAMGRLFLMREWLELSAQDICKELALTPTNLHVQLHRARLRLQECLNIHWFGQRGR